MGRARHLVVDDYLRSACTFSFDTDVTVKGIIHISSTTVLLVITDALDSVITASILNGDSILVVPFIIHIDLLNHIMAMDYLPSNVHSLNLAMNKPLYLKETMLPHPSLFGGMRFISL
jgi:hypothetical protein